MNLPPTSRAEFIRYQRNVLGVSSADAIAAADARWPLRPYVVRCSKYLKQRLSHPINLGNGELARLIEISGRGVIELVVLASSAAEACEIASCLVGNVSSSTARLAQLTAGDVP